MGWPRLFGRVHETWDTPEAVALSLSLTSPIKVDSTKGAFMLMSDWRIMKRGIVKRKLGIKGMSTKRGIEAPEVRTIVRTGPHRAERRGPIRKKKPPMIEAAAESRPKVPESVPNLSR